MDRSEAFKRIHETLIEAGFSYVSEPALYHGILNIEGYKVNVSVDVRDSTFVTLPKVELLDRGGLPAPMISHLATDGICYAAKGTLRLDLYRPGESILCVLKTVEAALAESASKAIPSGIFEEFPAYWSDDPIFIYDRPTCDQAKLFVSKIEIDGITALAAHLPGHRLPHSLSKVDEATVFFTDSVLWAGLSPINNLEDFWRWCDEMEIACKPAILKALSERKWIILRGENGGWIGLWIEPPQHLQKLSLRPKFLKSQIEMSPKSFDVQKFTGKDTTPDYIIERNLAERRSLKGLKIALIGCGTIGGYLAQFLAQNGAGYNAPLLLVDPEGLGSGNVGRHLLGANHIGKYKAKAVAEIIGNTHGAMDVVPIAADALKVWPRLRDCDLIIDATGIENVSDALSHQVLNIPDSKRPALLHSWIWGNGIASQAFLNDTSDLACYRCLRSDPEKPGWRYDPRKDVHENAQVIPPNCSEGTYVPFSVSAGSIAASLAIDLALDWVNGNASPRLRVICIDQQSTNHIKWTNPSKKSDCPAPH